jgi:hypothetical protein
MNIKVKCKSCDWEGKATVGKRGYPLDSYKCPMCSQNIERAKGRYDYYAGMARRINGKERWNTYSEFAKLK